MVRAFWLGCGVLAVSLLLHGCGEVRPKPTREALPYKPDAPKAADPIVLLKTSKGDIKLQLFEDAAPKAVANFIQLVEKGFYNGLTFYRIARDRFQREGEPFAVVAGDPKGNGTGTPGYRFADEIKDNPNKPQVFALCMGNPAGRFEPASTDNNGSQFFIVTTNEASWMEDKYTCFGSVVGTAGFDAVLRIARTGVDISSKDDAEREKPLEPITINKASVLSKRDHPYALKDSDKLAGEAPRTAPPAPPGVKTIKFPAGKTFKADELNKMGPVQIVTEPPAPPVPPAPAPAVKKDEAPKAPAPAPAPVEKKAETPPPPALPPPAKAEEKK
jgi:cyclophilin family peptidyl-prolyl cis-trans isomerase